ncbi:MAG: acetyltransferase [Oxalobacteraceae bacterium]|nr:MAG: acetyltransferase [Oxalobacteraceae bacterium]
MNGRTIIVGGGGFARELYFWLRDCADAGTVPPLVGYLDDAGDVLHNRAAYDMAFLGSVEDVVPREGDRFVLAIGSPATKRRIVDKLASRGAVFPRMIHPTCTVTGTAVVGEGVVLCPGCILGPDSTLERFVTFNTGSGTGHDSSVGEFSVLASRVAISGYVRIEPDVGIGSGVVLLPNVKVGRGAVIGPGCVVYRSVRPGTTLYTPLPKQLRLNKD